MHEATTGPSADRPAPSADRLLLDAAGVLAFVERAWPPAAPAFAEGILELVPGRCLFRRIATAEDERPGGSMRGPLLMEAIDQAGYVLVLGHLGEAALAVTSSLSVEFLRRPPIGALLVDLRIRRLGRTQVTMTGDLHVDEVDPARPVAVTTVTYSRALLG